METYYDGSEAGYSIHLNTIIQASTRAAYHISGGELSPGSDTRQLTVSVAAGQASVGGETVSWADTELVLTDAGDGPSSIDTGLPRVDVIYAGADSTLGVATGVPAAFAPDTGADGQPITPAPFEHWEPAPDDGTNVAGATLGFALIEPEFTSGTDIPAENIDQWKIGAGVDDSAFVRGDNSPNGTTRIEVGGNLFAVEDDTDTQPAFIKRDPNAPDTPLFLGTDDAPPTLRGGLRTNQNPVEYDSSGGNLEIADRNPDTPDANPIELSGDTAHINRKINAHSNALVDVGRIAFDSPTPALDFKPTASAVGIWEDNDPETGDILTAQTDLGRGVAWQLVYGGTALFSIAETGTVSVGESMVDEVSSIGMSRAGLSGDGQVRVRDDGTLMWLYGDTGYEIAGPGVQ